MQQPNEGTSRVIDPNRWKPGKYKAKPKDWALAKTRDGSPQVNILFEYEQPGLQPGQTEPRELIYFGSFKGGARERTLETLFLLGLRGKISDLDEGRDGGALDASKEVEIVVEHKDFNGVRKAGIAWVNQLGGRGMQGKLDKSEVDTLFTDLDQDYQATLMSKGITPKAGADSLQAGFLGESDIPF